ncbi:hypothetical protein BJV78DRAFT_1228592 [Lactifluus subvellereus]|nr:hypothetical protein BJV78DRAFT_1228592 [Lactifluus subvellereus]
MKPLAPELLEAIVAEVRSPETLLQLRTASSYLNTLATPLAFRSICFINKDNSLERFKRIANYDRDKLAQHIREVIYQYEEADPSEPVRPYALRGFDGTSFVETLAILSQLPALESLVLNFRSHDGPFSLGSDGDPSFPPEIVLQFLIFKALGEIDQGFASPLKSLTINRLLPLPHPSLREPTIITLLSTLTHLTINTTTNCSAFGMPEPHSDRSVFPKGALSSSLVSLQLHHACLRSPNMLAPITEIRLPHLAHLSLQRHYFSGRCEVENFITRHGETLVELKLFLCPMTLSTVKTSSRQSKRPRQWAQVWDRFRSELKVLKCLVVSERNDSNGVEDNGLGRYIDNSHSCKVVNLGKAETTDDENAYKRLQEVVESRVQV